MVNQPPLYNLYVNVFSIIATFLHNKASSHSSTFTFSFHFEHTTNTTPEMVCRDANPYPYHSSDTYHELLNSIFYLKESEINCMQLNLFYFYFFYVTGTGSDLKIWEQLTE